MIDADNLIAYEIEKSSSENEKREKIIQLRGANDIFIIDLKNVPDSFEKAEKYLKEKVVWVCWVVGYFVFLKNCRMFWAVFLPCWVGV